MRGVIIGRHFDSVAEIQDLCHELDCVLHHERPNMALGGITLDQRLALGVDFWQLRKAEN